MQIEGYQAKDSYAGWLSLHVKSYMTKKDGEDVLRFRLQDGLGNRVTMNRFRTQEAAIAWAGMAAKQLPGLIRKAG